LISFYRLSGNFLTSAPSYNLPVTACHSGTLKPRASGWPAIKIRGKEDIKKMALADSGFAAGMDEIRKL